MDQLNLIRIFVAVADAGGFSSAARKLHISPPAVTRAINDLESQLGVQLLARTTRFVRVTEAGARYADDCRRILGELAEANESVAGLHSAPRGHLALTAPVLFGAKFVTPIVTEYLRRYPEVTASCWFLDRVVNVMEEGLDIALRIGHLPDSSMRAIRVGEVRKVICASPAYLNAQGTPRTADDLSAHTIISAAGVTPNPEWRLLNNGVMEAVRLQPRLTTTTNDAAMAAAVDGFGLTRLLSYQVAERLRGGSLVAVLEDHEPPALPVQLVHHEGRHASRKARAFLDLAVERLRANPALNGEDVQG